MRGDPVGRTSQRSRIARATASLLAAAARSCSPPDRARSKAADPEVQANDPDGDSRASVEDDRPEASNPDRADADRDGIGGSCEGDRDGDGVPIEQDNRKDDPNRPPAEPAGAPQLATRDATRGATSVATFHVGTGVLLLFVGACSVTVNSDPFAEAPDRGGPGQPCLPDGSCDSGLTCVTDACVVVVGGGQPHDEGEGEEVVEDQGEVDVFTEAPPIGGDEGDDHPAGEGEGEGEREGGVEGEGEGEGERVPLPCEGDFDPAVDHDKDVDHCGGCGRACDGPHSTWACVEGRCLMLDCDPGWYDDDPEVDGCSRPGPNRTAVTVGPRPDGVEVFATLAEAAVAAEDGWTISVPAGEHPGPITVAADAVTIRGAAGGLVTITGEASEAAVVTLSGDDGRLEGVVVDARGGRSGVVVDCDLGGTLSDVTVQNVGGPSLVGEATGIEIRRTIGARVLGGVIRQIEGGHGPDGCDDTVGGRGTALRLTDTIGSLVHGVRITQIRGGQGLDIPCGDAQFGGGGHSAGVHSVDSSLVVVADVEISLLDGGAADPAASDPVHGGSAYGVQIAGGADAWLLAARISSLTGGAKSQGASSSSGAASGVVVSGVSRSLAIVGCEVSGLGCDGCTSGATSTAFFLADAPPAVLARNTVRGVLNGAGEAYGWRTYNSTVTIEQSLVVGLRGGTAAAFAGWYGSHLTVDRATIVDVQTTGTYAAALQTNTQPRNSVTARNCILSGVQNVGVSHGGTHFSGTTAISWSNLFDIPSPHDRATRADTNIGGEPAFALVPRDAYHLSANSPGVDAGDPADDCSREPLSTDEICHLDMGHLGNTRHARGR